MGEWEYGGQTYVCVLKIFAHQNQKFICVFTVGSLEYTSCFKQNKLYTCHLYTFITTSLNYKFFKNDTFFTELIHFPKYLQA